MPLPFSSDEELLAAARSGSPAAIDALIERLACVPAMLRLRERHLGALLNDDERREAAQDTIAAVWGKLELYRGNAGLEGWVWGFVVRELYKALERRRREAVPELGDALPAVERPRRDEECRARVERSLLELEPPDAEIVRMRHFEERSFAEIAAELAMPRSSVKTRYYRALVRLRVLLLPLWREVIG